MSSVVTSDLVIIFMFAAVTVFAVGVVGIDHCSQNTFTNNSTWMQFTKEAVADEFAVKGAFKSLHCCAKGYRSIEWYKDGKPYPWPSDSSSLILYPEAANQTVYTRAISPLDRGNYTCVLRNDTHLQMHEVRLQVVDRSPDSPRATFIPADQWVELGEPARLYCEAFVGHVGLPDVHSDVTWMHLLEGEGEPMRPKGTEEPVSREDGQIIGAYLIIPRVYSHHFGRYICSVGLGPATPRLEMSAWIRDRGPSNTGPVRWPSGIAMAVAALGGFLTAALVIKVTSSVYKRCHRSDCSGKVAAEV